MSENEINLTHSPFKNIHIPITQGYQIDLKFSWKNLTIKVKPERKALFFEENSEGKVNTC